MKISCLQQLDALKQGKTPVFAISKILTKVPRNAEFCFMYWSAKSSITREDLLSWHFTGNSKAIFYVGRITSNKTKVLNVQVDSGLQ